MTSSLETWRAVMQPAEVVAFFRGLFYRAGVRVTDTGEEFTCRHAGDRIEFEDGIRDDGLDFIVEIDSVQAGRLAEDARGGTLDAGMRYRIMAELAAPAAQAAFRRPMIRSRLLRSVLFMIGSAEMLMHVRLVPPAGEPEAQGYTVVYADGQTLIIPGFHGRVRREYRLTTEDAAEFQRRLLRARRANRLRSWLAFARWYGGLRRRVAVPVSGGGQ